MGSVDFWWIRTPTGEEFGPIATVGIQRLINENIITTSDEIREESSERYQRFINCAFFSFSSKPIETEKTEVEKTEVLKSEVGRTCLLRSRIEISPAKPQKSEQIEAPVIFDEPYRRGGFLRKAVFLINVTLYTVLVVFIVEKYSENNAVSFNQPSKRSPASVSKSFKKRHSGVRNSR